MLSHNSRVQSHRSRYQQGCFSLKTVRKNLFYAPLPASGALLATFGIPQLIEASPFLFTWHSPCVSGCSDGKESACNAETRVWPHGWEDAQRKGMAILSSILVWRIPWTEEPDRLQSMESQKNQTLLSDWHFHFLPGCIPSSKFPLHLRTPVLSD